MQTPVGEHDVDSVVDSAADLESMSLCGAFLNTVARWGSESAFVNEVDGAWVRLSFDEYATTIARAAAGLRDLGVQRGDRVLLHLRTRLEHHVLDWACVFLGAVPVSVYFSSSPKQLAYIANHSKASWMASDDQESAARFRAALPMIDRVPRHIVLHDSEEPGVVTYAALTSSAVAPADLRELAGAVSPTDWCTFIYTSGTTGRPKCVPIPHRTPIHYGWRFTQRSGQNLERARAISYGPLAHGGERCFTHYYQMLVGLELTDCTKLADLARFREARKPNLWFGAPRGWELLRSAILAYVAAETTLGEQYDQALEIGWRRFGYLQSGQAVPVDLEDTWRAVERTVVKPVLAHFGLDEVKIALTGAAKMSPDLHRWWLSNGYSLSDQYGMTETIGVTWNPIRITMGTSGTPLPGMSVVISPDGEILVRGPHPFPGYLNDDGDSPVDADGWFHTGDRGEIDAEGNLHVIDRIKDVLVPSSGHNVSPVHLETALSEHPLVGQSCVVGNGYAYCTALVLLDPEAAPVWAIEHGLGRLSVAEVAASAQARESIKAHIMQTNKRYPRPEQLGEFTIVEDQWPPDSTFVTATNKLRRLKIHDYYTPIIDAMYSAEDLRV